MAYDNRFVAFLDILGFKNIIEGTENDDSAFERVKRVLEYISEVQRDNYEGLFAKYGITKEVSVFSDSIVISYSDQMRIGGALFHVLLDLVFICNDLLYQNIFVRGGVTYGQMYHNKNLSFGPAMVNAYLLEEDKAIYPRIIVEENAIKMGLRFPGQSNTVEMEAKYLEGLLCKDNDGNFHLDSLAQDQEFNDWDTYVLFMYDVRDYLLSHLSAGYTERIREKYIWFAEYYNRTVEKKFDPARIAKMKIALRVH